MDIKIGLRSVNRELTLDVPQSEEEIRGLVRQAMENKTILELKDKRNNTYVVNGALISYLEISPASTERVGFSL